MAFHHWPDVVPGGFIGVTTFLVLAGVLAIVRIGGELTATGGFDWRAYAQGRIRRLLPALLFYAGVVLAWTYATRPEIYAAVTADAAAALVYITPWREMVGSVTYESAFDTTPAPFVHTWSLGVEELAWVLTGLSIAVLRRAWVAVAATTIAGVIGYAMWFGSSDVYYSPARLAEFAIGAVIGLLILRRPVSVPWPITGLCIVTLGWWAAAWTVRDVYSGRLLAAAVVSAVLVAGCLSGPIARLLSIGPLRCIGTRSYSLYLWHIGVGELTELPSVAAIAVTGALAEVSFRVVENPIRVRAVLRRRAIGILSVATMALLGVAALGPGPTSSVPEPRRLRSSDQRYRVGSITPNRTVNLERRRLLSFRLSCPRPKRHRSRRRIQQWHPPTRRPRGPSCAAHARSRWSVIQRAFACPTPSSSGVRTCRCPSRCSRPSPSRRWRPRTARWPTLSLVSTTRRSSTPRPSTPTPTGIPHGRDASRP
jgi:peptidoglycan/LPS O-acetylase OafA/YrhL